MPLLPSAVWPPGVAFTIHPTTPVFIARVFQTMQSQAWSRCDIARPGPAACWRFTDSPFTLTGVWLQACEGGAAYELRVPFMANVADWLLARDLCAVLQDQAGARFVDEHGSRLPYSCYLPDPDIHARAAADEAMLDGIVRDGAAPARLVLPAAERLVVLGPRMKALSTWRSWHQLCMDAQHPYHEATPKARYTNAHMGGAPVCAQLLDGQAWEIAEDVAWFALREWLPNTGAQVKRGVANVVVVPRRALARLGLHGPYLDDYHFRIPAKTDKQWASILRRAMQRGGSGEGFSG